MGKSYYLGLLSCLFAFSGCIGNVDLYVPPTNEPEDSYFDFSTTSEISFDIDYGKIGGRALINIFTDYPLTYNEDGTYEINGEAAYKIFADENGRFSGKVELRSGLNNVYLVSQAFGVPLCLELSVNNGSVTWSSTKATKAGTRAADDLKVYTVDESLKMYSLFEWSDKYGKPIDANGLISEGNVDPSLTTSIQQTLWGGTTKPGSLNNSKLLRDTEHINTSIAKAYKKADGTVVNVKDAEVYFTFITEAGWYQNTVGYYYYKTGECPSSADGVKKFVIFPNASIDGNVPFVNTAPNKNAKAYGYGNAPITSNLRVKLLYEDENGNLSTTFPAGYTIGYFVIQEGFENLEKINTSKNILYSNAEWNPEYQGKRERFISLATSDGTVVYGSEDGADKSYDDVLFSIDANPNDAIQDPDRPVIDPVIGDVVATEETTRTYAYEDLWPDKGDYDMNDVIVLHKRTVTFNNDNYVREVKDVFADVHPDGSSDHNNAFAAYFAPSQRGTLSLSDGVVEETATNCIILFPDSRLTNGQNYVVTRSFENKKLLKKDLLVSDASLNPFIVVKYNGVGKGNRTEVHLPKMSPTSLVNKSLIGTNSDAYYIDKDGKYPFAISIPGTFTPVTERVSISDEYLRFDSWVSSNGEKDADWYLYYKQ